MALEGVVLSLVSAGLSYVIAKLAGDPDVPASDLAGCVLRLLPGRKQDETSRIAEALEAEVEAALAGAPRPDAGGAAALRDATELVQRFGLSSDQLGSLAHNVAPDEGAGPWRPLAAEAARRVVENGRQRLAGDDAHRAFCLRIVTAYYRAVLQNDECRQRLLPTLVATGIATVREDISDLKRLILERVGGESGVPLPVLHEVLTRMGEKAVALDLAATEAQLRRKAEEYLDLRGRWERLTTGDTRVSELRRAAAQALAVADFDEADRRLAQAEALDLEVVEELEANVRRRRLSAAERRAERGAAARLRLDYQTAADHFAAAAALLPPDADAERERYQINQGVSLCELGQFRGDKNALLKVTEILLTLLDGVSRATRPLDWAAIQNNLGNAHFQMAALSRSTGECEHAIGQFRNAANAYTAALAEFDREREPVWWSAANNNLGNVLAALGEHTRDAALLRQALAAYCEALKVRRRARVPFDWAETRCNLGNALDTMYELEHSAKRLRQARAAYIAALQVYTRDRMPLRWAEIQNNLSLTLLRLGQHVGDPEPLREALDCLTGARQVLVVVAGQTHRAAEFEQKVTWIEAAIRDLDGSGRAPPRPPPAS